MSHAKEIISIIIYAPHKLMKFDIQLNLSQQTTPISEIPIVYVASPDV